MNRRLTLLVALLLASLPSACTSASNGDAGPDPGLFPCPLSEPSGACTTPGTFGPWCVYGSRQCRCNADGPSQWVCESSMCPTAPIQTGTACSTPGLVCDPAFESSCICLNREHTWFCCNGGIECPGNYVEHGLCCSGLGHCGFVDGGVGVNPMCVDNHWHITTTPIDAGRD